MVGDSANRDALEVMGKEFPMVPASKGAGSIIDGIDLVRNLLKPRTQLVGNPKPSMFVSSVCRNFIIEMESYKYPEEKENRNPSDLPLKENDHGLDAYRYVVLHLKHGSQKETDVPKAKMQFNDYGLI
jgi:phage terminase large subunit